MEIHRQTCQECGSVEHVNILCREPGEHDMVVIICAKCDSFVARYVLETKGYYHHGKGFESYLRGLNRGGDYSSGKVIISDFENMSKEAVDLFQRVAEFMKTKYDG